MNDRNLAFSMPYATAHRRARRLDWLLGPRRQRLDRRASVALRSLCLVTVALAGCDVARGRFGDMTLPADCNSSCPSGYSCDNGTCVGGNAQSLDFDLSTFPVTATLTIDGQAPLAGSGCSGNQVDVDFSEGAPPKSFFDPIVGSLVDAPMACDDSDGAVATRLPAGQYRVLASRADSNTSFPEATVTLQSTLAVKAAVTQTWDVTTVPVSGVLTIDGQPPVAGSGCSGNHVDISFIDDSGGSFTTSIPCSDASGTFGTRVAPGSYRVIATRADSNTTFPAASVVVKSSFQLSGASAGLAWNVATVPVSGVVTIDGQPPVAGSGCSGDHVTVAFVDDAGASYSASIACDVATGAFATRVAAGTYRVLASRADSNTSFPAATVVLQSSFTAAGAVSGLHWNVDTIPVSGVVTIDGQPPVAGSGCSGDHVTVAFVDDAGASYSASIACEVATGAFATRVAAGTYRVLASRADSNTSFPEATLALAGAFSATSTPQQWNVVTVPVSGHVLVDGQPPIAGSACSGDQVRVTFFDAIGGSYDYSIPCTDATGAFALRLAAGTYHALASRTDSNTSFPDATFTLVDAIAIH